MPRVFFITGCSSGFGASLVEAILSNGDSAVATSRHPEAVNPQGATATNFLAQQLDVTSPESISSAFASTLAKFNRIDVVINNAGYGLAGVLEELSDEQIQREMDVNFFGVVKVTRAAIRVMREVNSPSGGLIVQMTSIGGQLGMPLLSSYCSSKWAVEGLTESVMKEMKPEWNIRFMCVEPGGFRTDWAHKSMEYPEGEMEVAAYDHLKVREGIRAMAEAQEGDPVKGAEAIYRLSLLKDPPLRVPLGSEAFDAMASKIKTYGETFRKFEDLARHTDIVPQERYELHHLRGG
ncbi:MAG: hypothetical protein L6R37_007828 [Teloschistes peruensis]|nr:MAG: hypothetical protein L6R37_007828 [Teloschistes peruensis]